MNPPFVGLLQNSPAEATRLDLPVDRKERGTLVEHLLADGIQQRAVIFTFLPDSRQILDSPHLTIVISPYS